MGRTDVVEVVISIADRRVPYAQLVDAVQRIHPQWNVHKVWVAEPSFRPSGPGWVDAAGPERVLASLEPDARGLYGALSVLKTIATYPAIILRAGALGVQGPLDSLVPSGAAFHVVPKLLRADVDDGLFPRLAEVGSNVSTSVAAFGTGGDAVVDWLIDRLADRDPAPTELLVSLAADLFGATSCHDPAVGASAWRWDVDEPVLVDAPNFDRYRPWLLDPTLTGRPRVSLAAPGPQRTLARIGSQFGPSNTELKLPSGIEIDATIRRLIRMEASSLPAPWSEAHAFRQLLETRYWEVTHANHPDLVGSFPSPFGADGIGYARWTRRAGSEGRAPVLLRPLVDPVPSVRRVSDRADGVNLIGYFRRQSGVGDIARRVAEVLGRRGVAHCLVDYDRSSGPLVCDPPECDQELRFSTTIAFVNRDQFHHLCRDVPELSGPGRRVVGVWFWELDTFAGRAMDHACVDEVWSATNFMAEAFREVDGVEVSVVPIPIAEPVPAIRDRTWFPPLEDVGDRFVFGAILDHMSVTDRKNPLGAIDAFKRAFVENEGPVLVIKTLNAAAAWSQHERLLVAASDRDDVVVWDANLSREDQFAFVTCLDALVSLHRSEGLGLHLAESMWLGTPVIATGYSGNLDFMDESSTLLVDADLVDVGHRGGWAYPADAHWAEPDVGQAAAFMRRLVSEPALRTRLATAGRRRIERYAIEDEFVGCVLGMIDRGAR